MKTYIEVAESQELSASEHYRYVMYMKTRWPDTEEQKCRDGYATEWAIRFKLGREYACSDREGQSILMTIYTGA